MRLSSWSHHGYGVLKKLVERFPITRKLVFYIDIYIIDIFITMKKGDYDSRKTALF